MYTGNIYTINVPLQCRWVCLYAMTEFPYYIVFVKIPDVQEFIIIEVQHYYYKLLVLHRLYKYF